MMMAWDADENSLYAATKCLYMDRDADYRRAKFPKEKENEDAEKTKEGDEGDCEDEDEEDGSLADDRYWPTRVPFRELLFDTRVHRNCKRLFSIP